jgi:two-component flavin-dependent monooxygenase
MVSGHLGADLGADLGAAAKLGELAAAHAAVSEAGRRLTPEVAAAIADAGFVRHFVPARWGGAEGGFLDYLRAVELVGEGDPSAAWVAAISASLGRMACYLPPAAQAELWADGPDVFLACALVPGGTATAAPGGWLVSGVWRYLSGVHFSGWALVACPVPGAGGTPEVRFLLVPRDAYTIEDSWYSVGMRATGSDSLRLDQVFVPEGRSFARDALVAGRAPAGAPAAASAPIKVMSGLSFAGPILGAARAALHELTGQTAARRRPAGPQHRVHGSGDVSVELALARGLAAAGGVGPRRGPGCLHRGACGACGAALRARRRPGDDRRQRPDPRGRHVRG